jgi:hypothetical protein
MAPSTSRSQFESLLVIVAGLLIIAYLKTNVWLGGVAFSFLTLGLIIKPLRVFIHKLWWKLAHILGYINGKIIFTILYILMIVPFSFFYNRNNKRTKPLHTNFKERNHTFVAEDLKRIF